MNATAYQIIKDTYDYDTCKEIVSHGCKSGVCSEHIYYADTISFFDKYEDEIYSELEECYGVDTLVSIFKESNAHLGQYKNDVVWLYIEHVSSIVVTTMEEEEAAQDELIASYMKEEISNNGYTLSDLNGYNPPLL